ncbi:MAG: phosphate ABC transporter substrate-binding protein [Oscillospiraceae bacterium]|nr:phosphate ABC transporter substrate-binding protein [Oscillospiraceae bacterium]
MKNKKLLALLLGGALTIGSLTGCGAANTPAADASSQQSTAANTATAQPEANTPATTLTGNVKTGGSTSMEKVMDALMEAFAEENPGVKVTYDPTGSGAGITGAQEGTLDIGLSSRGLHDDEAGVTAVTVAIDGIAVVVNKDNAIADLALDDIAKIATGEITNWSALGGQDGEIVFVGREAGSGTRDGFESIVGVSDACLYDQELTATGAVIAAVAQNKNAIGYASLSAVEDTVNAVSVDGVACSEQTVLDGTYAIQRPFNFVLSDGSTPSAQVQAFLDFATGAAAAERIVAAGAVPASK